MSFPRRIRIRRAAALLATAVVAALAAGSAAAHRFPIGPQVAIEPAVVPLRHTATITVWGVETRTLEVRLAGATTRLGKLLPWLRLHGRGGVWRGRLPTPEFRGLYPVELRERAGARVLRSEGWLFAVLATGTMSRPSFRTPEEVAQWWVRTVPAHAKLVALKRWPRPDFDRRDRRLHQLLVLAYRAAASADRLGIFVTAVRDGFHGRWRLLEATAAP